MTEEYKKNIKIYNEIKHLSWRIKGVRSLSPHQLTTAQNDALLAIILTEKAGKIQLVEYTEYKNYLFIITKNAILSQLKKTKIQKITDSGHSLSQGLDMSYDDYISTNQVKLYVGENETIKEKLIQLSQIERAIIRWKIRGWLLKDIAKALSISENTMGKRWKKIKEKMR